MFLIYGIPRSGTTRLCHELGARVPHGCRVLNEPFHPSPVVRRAYGSECGATDPDEAHEWLIHQAEIAGIKLVANRTDSVFAGRFHATFERVIILNRDPVDVAISLEAANQTENWNRGDGISGDWDPPVVRVSRETLAMVREFLGNLNDFRNLRRQSGIGGLHELEYDGTGEVADAANLLGLPVERLREPFRSIRRMRISDSRESRCTNVSEVVDYFRK